jgi:ATP phosphoribosyltransferase (homohexameric) (EC 2.4.2.17)
MITLALPKGSLEAQTLQLFKEADLEVRRTDRDYNPCIADSRIGKVKILRPQEIPTYVDKGYFDLGISGLDWVRETKSDVVEVAALTYSKTGEGNVKIVIAVQRDEPIENASQIRPGSKVTTEYPELTKQFFEKKKIPVQLFHSYGASEAKVPGPHGRGRGFDRDGDNAAEKRPQDHRPDHGVAHGDHRKQG